MVANKHTKIGQIRKKCLSNNVVFLTYKTILYKYKTEEDHLNIEKLQLYCCIMPNHYLVWKYDM